VEAGEIVPDQMTIIAAISLADLIGALYLIRRQQKRIKALEAALSEAMDDAEIAVGEMDDAEHWAAFLSHKLDEAGAYCPRNVLRRRVRRARRRLG
jgi:hypothetical protein